MFRTRSIKSKSQDYESIASDLFNKLYFIIVSVRYNSRSKHNFTTETTRYGKLFCQKETCRYIFMFYPNPYNYCANKKNVALNTLK